MTKQNIKDFLTSPQGTGMERVLFNVEAYERVALEESDWPTNDLLAELARLDTVSEVRRVPFGYEDSADVDAVGGLLMTPQMAKVMARLHMNNKQIGRTLGIQETTVKHHIKALTTKFKAANRTHLAIKAAVYGGITSRGGSSIKALRMAEALIETMAERMLQKAMVELENGYGPSAQEMLATRRALMELKAAMHKLVTMERTNGRVSKGDFDMINQIVDDIPSMKG